ncbi:long-chain-fatty-acid--CoA ligase 6 isoform X4 [Triplophysa dalaica]|nr:long-chain-fatty-acid--CoA ligase 6 isoform X4 [Triplophysa dalaica]XP_056586261.1 long-chain-fatty-acid--CoA ligase 6 isoform X4 [Triplophysa dalaica]XP_056586262.1 long-chain-fatty-acid--CoA ligase 6 isoform X4 [Triplophysa dalaica]XP_056586263.1 long-chain-fatty-acid--CoA ligase 6 isoform X4 [Triplophysa dalaica]
MEKMQSRDLLLGLQLPELDELGQLIQSLPTSALVGLGAITAVLAYWFATRPRAIIPPCDLRHQSQEVEKEDGARRSMMGSSSKLLSHYHEDAKTMYEVFQRGLHITGDGPFLGSRLPNQPYKWLSYKEVFSRAENLGSGLLSQGCQPNTDQFIGVFAQNRPEWIIAELACYTYSMVVVPLYDTLGPDAIRFIINTAEIATVICDKPEKAKVLLGKVERGETPGLKTIILMDAFDLQLVEEGRKCAVHIQALKDVEALGKEKHRKPVPPEPDDLSIVCFTSGTTGNPKGVMLTHGNVVADFGGFLKVTDKVIFPNQDDVLISFLPLAHMFERLIESVVICHGGRIGFFQGDIRLLPDDMKALRPTIFPVVPRLLNRMYDKIFSQANTSVKRWLLNFAAKRKGAEVSRGVIRCDSIWDKIFFHKIQASLGGRLRMIITGAAPASPSVLGFLRAALGCQVYEAYGQTECTAGCTFTTPGDWTSGHVGAPLPCNLIKLVDVAEKNYFAAKGEGEVCVKGPNVFKGYLKDPVRTAETLDKDGWLHTGDIGKWLPNGTLRIIDRKKHIFKLAQGEYISPEKIENIYIRSEPVAQLYVHGDSLQSCLVGIVVPDPEVFPSWAQKKGFEGCFEELCENKELKKAILDDMVRLGKTSGLHSFEQVKDIQIHKDMFSIQNGLLTPTLKAKRPELKEYFKTEIEQLYSNISM